MDAPQELKSSSSEQAETDTPITTVSDPTSPCKLVQDTKAVSNPFDSLPVDAKVPTSLGGSATYAEIVSGRSKIAGRGAKSQRGARMASCDRAAIRAEVIAQTPEQRKAYWKRLTGSEKCKYVIRTELDWN